MLKNGLLASLIVNLAGPQRLQLVAEALVKLAALRCLQSEAWKIRLEVLRPQGLERC
jgi:hypothetical protein